MTTSNTELAAQARKSAEWLDSLDLRAPDKIMNAVSAATSLRQLADAVESKAEPAFYGFMNEENCTVDLCFTPGTPRADGVYATAYYTAPAQPGKDERDQALQFLAGLHPGLTIDGPPMEVATRIFESVQAETEELRRQIESCERSLEMFRSMRAHGIGSSTEGGR